MFFILMNLKLTFMSMYAEKYLPSISVDCVIFGFHKDELNVLLLKMKESEGWMLPGGFVAKDQDLNAEASTVLKRRTGLENIFLRQFYVFGNLDRAQETGHIDRLLNKKIIDSDIASWFEQRFISVGYYALVEYSEVLEPVRDYISDECSWVPILDLPPLLLDHKTIIEKAHETLKKELYSQPIGLNLLPDEFTMTELQSLYETILQRTIDRRNFRRKMLSMKVLKDTGKRRTGLGHRAPILYTFDQEAYQAALDNGFQSSAFF